MEAKETYMASDCIETGSACSIKGKVVVLSCEAMSKNCPNQLFYCLCGNGAGANSSGCAVFLVSLSSGEFSLKKRSDVVGVLKPELLPDQAKLQLSQIRPQGALDLKSHEPKYSGYSFLPGNFICLSCVYADGSAIYMEYIGSITNKEPLH